jgi:hypothetical protein
VPARYSKGLLRPYGRATVSAAAPQKPPLPRGRPRPRCRDSPHRPAPPTSPPGYIGSPQRRHGLARGPAASSVAGPRFPDGPGRRAEGRRLHRDFPGENQRREVGPEATGTPDRPSWGRRRVGGDSPRSPSPVDQGSAQPARRRCRQGRGLQIAPGYLGRYDYAARPADVDGPERPWAGFFVETYGSKCETVSYFEPYCSATFMKFCAVRTAIPNSASIHGRNEPCGSAAFCRTSTWPMVMTSSVVLRTRALISAAATYACADVPARSNLSAQRVLMSAAPRYDLKPRLAESFVEAGTDVAVIAFGADFIFAADLQHVAL